MFIILYTQNLIEKEVMIVFNLPTETFWLVVPWPFIWLTAGIVMYFVNKRQDDLEDKYYADLDKKELK